MADLQNRLREAEETLQAIRSGAVDALVVSGPQGENVFTLKSAESPYRVLVESMNEGAANVSSEGIVLYCNNKLATMLERPLGSIIGSSLRNFVEAGNRQIYDALIKKGLQSAASAELVLTTERALLPVYCSCHPLKLDGMTAVSIIITDISEHKKAEKALRRAHDKLELRVRERTADLESSRAELEVQNEELRVIQEELETSRAELEMQNKELRESEERYRSLVELSPDAIIVHAEGKIVYLNRVALNLYGAADAYGIIGKNILDLVPSEERETVKERIAQSYRKPGPTPLRETRILRLDGTPVEVEVSGVLITYNGKPAMQVVLRDITERKQADRNITKLNKDLLAKNAELESANKELDSIAHSVSHELRAPLRSMSGFAKILREDYADKLDEQGNDYLDRVFNGSEKMTLRIEALLHLARLSRQDIELTRVNLTSVASSVVYDLGAADSDRGVEVKIAEGLTATADLALVKVALANLFGNAWKFTSKTPDARIEFGTMDKEGKTVYFIRDNGAGFDPTYADKMFQPFHRFHSDNEFEGTGIGLSIVERVIRRHGGRIWAEGSPGKGATFYFTLG